RATTSFLDVQLSRSAPAPVQTAESSTPSEAATAGRPARSELEAFGQTSRLVDQRIAELLAGPEAPATNRALIEKLAPAIAKDARTLSCDLVNECGHLRRSLDD